MFIKSLAAKIDETTFKTWNSKVNPSELRDTAKNIRDQIPQVRKYQVGDFAQGGVVFWVDETGQHGLACAIEDQDEGNATSWDNRQISLKAHGDGIYAGEMNTILIITGQENNYNEFAAGICANLIVTHKNQIYGDWYLPSKEELLIMYEQKLIINQTSVSNEGKEMNSLNYWSSTERISGGGVWGIRWSDGEAFPFTRFQLFDGVGVRAIRSF